MFKIVTLTQESIEEGTFKHMISYFFSRKKDEAECFRWVKTKKKTRIQSDREENNT